MENFEQLQELGSKKIVADTHIPLAHLEMILKKDFSQFKKPQFFGFLSIIEREYKIDLSSLKQEYLFELAGEEISQEDNFDLAETRSKVYGKGKSLLENRKVLYGAGAGVVALLLFVLISSIDFSSSNEEKIEINNTAIDKAKKNLNIEPVHVANVEEMLQNNDVESAEFGQDEKAAKSEKSKTVEAEKPAVKKAPAKKVASKKISRAEPVSGSEPTMALYFRIVPKGRLWLGIINAETHRRRVETISKPLILDAEKEWLIVTGYGHLDMDCGDTTYKYREDKKLLFLYENGICQIIDKEEFKARNRGKLW